MHSLFSDDLKKLNALYQRIQFSFIFLYGRYDTGKTRLVREFCAGKRALFFSAREAVSSQQLSAFWRDTVRSLQPAKTPAPFRHLLFSLITRSLTGSSSCWMNSSL